MDQQVKQERLQGRLGPEIKEFRQELYFTACNGRQRRSSERKLRALCSESGRLLRFDLSDCSPCSKSARKSKRFIDDDRR